MRSGRREMGSMSEEDGPRPTSEQSRPCSIRNYQPRRLHFLSALQEALKAPPMSSKTSLLALSVVKTINVHLAHSPAPTIHVTGHGSEPTKDKSIVAYNHTSFDLRNFDRGQGRYLPVSYISRFCFGWRRCKMLHTLGGGGAWPFTWHLMRGSDHTT
jgi:hypothetical protein